MLGSRVDSDGNPPPLMMARVTEGVREYERGVAPRLIMTGGPDSGRPAQAEVMARVAESQGVPASAVLLEPKARDTMENACFTARILKQHGWHSAEVVTSASHTPRAGMIFSELPIDWRMHTAPPLEPVSTLERRSAGAEEILKTVRYLIYARWADACSQ